MLKTRKRWVSLLVAVVMLAALLVPMVGTASAAAAGYSIVTTVPTFDATNDAASNLETATVQIKVDPAVASASTARIEALSGDGSQLKILGALVSDTHAVTSATINGATVTANVYQIIGAKSFNFAFTPNTGVGGDTKAWINVKLYVDAKNAASGDVKLDLFNTGNQLIPGQIVVATAAGGSVTAALVGGTASIGEDTSSNVTLRVTENSAGAMKKGLQTLKFKLPAGFGWTVASANSTFDYTANGGPAGNLTVDSDRTLYVNITTASTTSYVVDVTAGIAVIDKDTAKKGDVSVSLDANNDATISPSDITVGNYGDYGVNVSVASVKNLIAGDNAEKTDTITIEETIAGSLIEGRNVTVEFPNTVKVVSLENKTVSNATNTLPTIDGTSDKFSFIVKDTSATDKAKYQFKAKLSIQGNVTGDLAATVSGAGIPDKTSLKVAKIVAPVAVTTSTSGNVKIGVQGQDAPDITITEAVSGAIQRNASGDALELVLPSGARWAGVPTVQVTAGDIDLDTDNITINNSSQVNSSLGSDDAVLRIPVKSSSSKASTIKISGIKLTIDRTAPEGQLSVKITGLGVIVNYQNGTLNDTKFATDNAGSFVIAKVVTPGAETGTAVFKIGATSYTLNGVSATLDAPPYIKNGRTLLPVRAIANAVGVSNDNIIWDPAGKVTVIKGDRVVQLTIGSSVMLVNGAPIGIEVAPEITAGRTFLPLRALAQALSAGIAWDDATQTVTVTF